MASPLAIIGAGVSGLTCGVLAAERGFAVTIFAAETGQGTTSSVAGAIWFPYDAGPAESIVRWSLETYERLVELSTQPETGVAMIELRNFTRRDRVKIPEWAIPLGARKLASAELLPDFADGFALNVPLTDTSIYLDYLANRFRAAGGEMVETKPLKSFAEIDARFPAIFNCSGLGAKELRPDPGLAPHRGQIALTAKLDLPFAVVCDDPPLFYMIPRTNDCVLGGTNDESSARDIDPATTARILSDCRRLLPVEPHLLGARVGMRPHRQGGVCLAREHAADGRLIVHNYGHGGSGFTLSWGCAREALDLL